MGIRFYKPFSNNIEVISFDLDDTLYENEQVIHEAEQAQFDAVCGFIPKAREIGISFWIDLKWQVLKEQPEVRHDVTLWRQAVIEKGLTQQGADPKQVAAWSKDIFAAFYQARSNFEIPSKTHHVLTKLKTKWPIIAVTNGNADIHRLDLAKYFTAYYRAGEKNTKSKPYPDMLNLAASELNVKPQNILHIGDNVKSDIGAANNAKTMSLWYNPNQNQFKKGTALPNGEYSDLDDLLHLL